MTHAFPQTPDFIVHNEPVRIECDIYDLIVEGKIPEEINGVWYRSIPDPQYPSKEGNDVFISGDGMVGAFYFENGHVDYKCRYVMTERLKNDRAARRSLYGVYRNPFTDDASVQGKGRGVANTTPVYHGGKLLALKEDSLAWELDPITLETIGEFDYEGKLKSKTMSAHTRLDPETGELFVFGYEASGLASTDVSYWIVDKEGQLKNEQWFKVPYCAMMHDFVVTKEHVLFPVFPTVCELERLKAGGSHWGWDSSKNSFVGIMPRYGDVSEMRWFEGPPAFSYHMMNAYTDHNMVHMDLCVADVNVFPFVQEAAGIKINPAQTNGRLARWSFDMAGNSDTWTETILGPDGEMPRIAEKDFMKDYEIAYYANFMIQNGRPIISGPVHAGFNTASRINIKTGEIKSFSAPDVTLQEPVHVTSKQSGHEGYIIIVGEIFEKDRSDVYIFEAEKIDAGPIATIKMPLRLRDAVHGNWVPAEQLKR
jgi:carotenoid cleavage dioxygenase